LAGSELHTASTDDFIILKKFPKITERAHSFDRALSVLIILGLKKFDIYVSTTMTLSALQSTAGPRDANSQETP